MTTKNNHTYWQRVHQMLLPYYDVLIFVIAMLVAHFFWKYTIHGDEDGFGAITWFGMDITAPFDYFAERTAAAVYWIVSLVRDTMYQVDATTLRFTSGSGAYIVWSCTPLKQAFIWLVILLATPAIPIGNSGETHIKKAYAWLHKLWFIPVGWILIYFINILRISAIMLFIEHHPEWFELLHTYIFKYIFYGLMFLLWVWYVERIRSKH